MRRRRVLSWCILRRGDDLVLAELLGGIPSRWVCASSNPWYAYLYRRVNRTRGYSNIYRVSRCASANYGKGILNHRRCFAFSKTWQVLCALLQERCSKWIRAASIIRWQRETLIRARNRCIFQGAELYLFLFKNKIFSIYEG